LNLSSLITIFSALEKAKVRYLVVGGVAVVTHGYPRLTMDLDLVIQLVSDNLQAAFHVFKDFGYRPSIPISLKDFVDPSIREQWIREKGMMVLNLYSDNLPETPLDIFVSEPFDFDKEYETAFHAEITPGLIVPFVSISTLISMKKNSGRSLDNDDIKQLEQILKERNNDRKGSK